MTTKEKIATYSKAIEILELLERAEKRLLIYETDLNIFNNKSRHDQLMSLYQRRDYEWSVKKGKRSVSFIKGMYERYVNKMFANSLETPGYTVTTLQFKNIDFTAGIDLSREYKNVLHFPSLTGEWLNRWMQEVPFELIPARDITTPGLPDFFKLLFPSPVIPYNIHSDD